MIKSTHTENVNVKALTESRSTNARIIISGRNVETYNYKEGVVTYGFPGYKGPRKKKIEVVDEESRRKKEDSRRRSMLRSKAELTRIINANAGEYKKETGEPYPAVFATFTFKEDVKEIKTANGIFTCFIKRLNYEFAEYDNLKYTVITEFQDRNRDGVIHYHAIFFNLPFIESDKLAEIWGQGFVKLNKIDRVKNIGGYVTKYMSKNFDDNRLDGHKRYFSSRGLLRPRKINNQLVARQIMAELPENKIVEASEFTSKYNGKVEYKRYKLDRCLTTEEIFRMP